MQRRIFIGIDIPETEKKRLFKYCQQWKDLPVIMGREENYHLTLSFLGYVDDEEIAEVVKAVNEAVLKFEPFYVEMDRIILAPPGKTARMFWLWGEKNEQLAKLKNAIENSLSERPVETKMLAPHITLCRIKRGKWEELSKKPEIENPYKLTVSVDGVNIYESTVIDGKRKFLVIERCELG